MSAPARRTDAPNLAEQIEAVLTARYLAQRLLGSPKTPLPMRDGDLEDLSRALAAAAETLKTLEFIREVAR